MDLIEATLIDIFPARNMALLYPDDCPISWKGFLIFKRRRSAEPIKSSVLPVPLVPNTTALRLLYINVNGWSKAKSEELLPLAVSVVEQQAKELCVDAARGTECRRQEADAVVVGIRLS